MSQHSSQHRLQHYKHFSSIKFFAFLLFACAFKLLPLLLSQGAEEGKLQEEFHEGAEGLSERALVLCRTIESWIHCCAVRSKKLRNIVYML